MARLPSALDLSGPASLRSGRQYASADETAIGRGMQSVGSDIQALGGELKRQADEERAKQNAVDIARAEAFKTEGFLNTQNEFDNDPDYSTYQKRVPAKTGEIVKSAANLIRDPEMRERWQIGAQTDSMRVNDSIFDRGTTLRRQTEVVAFDDALETNRRIYVDPNTSEEAKAKAKADIQGAIKTGLATGLLTPEAADSRRKTFIEDAEFSRGKLEAENNPAVVSTARIASGPTGQVITNAAARHGVPPEALLKIAVIESGGNPNARNPRSSAGGLFQFIDSTARQYGLSNKFDPAQAADAAARLMKDNAAHLRGVLGREPTAGELYLAHQQGAGGAAKLLASPDRPAVDVIGWDAVRLNGGAPGMTAGQFAQKWVSKADGASAKVPDWWPSLSPEQQNVVLGVAETQQNKNNVEARAAIDIATTNAPTAILNTGSYDGQLPTADQFMAAYGPQEGAERFKSFLASVETSEQAYNMRTMSTEQITEMVNAARPASSGDDAALEAARYKTLASAAEATLNARTSDPATYTRQTFPAVEQAWRAAATNGDYQTALTQTAAAQRQLGIVDMKLLPKDIAEGAVTKFKDVNLNEKDRIESAMGLVFSTPAKAQRQAVFQQLVDAGLPEITEGAVEALSRGDQGAARRLFQAAMLDPSKLPGQAPNKPAEIDEAIQGQLMAEGSVGDIYYGLSDGSTGNFVKAERDQKLMTNAVNLRIRNGEELSAAVDAVAKDMFGDVQPVTGGFGVNAQILLPSKVEPEPVLAGLESMMPRVREALTSAFVVPEGVEGNKAVVDKVTENYVNNVLAEGYFRNSGDGFVFFDPYTGAAVAGADGQPMVFTLDDAIAAAPKPRVRSDGVEAPLTDDSFDAFQKRMQQ